MSQNGYGLCQNDVWPVRRFLFRYNETYLDELDRIVRMAGEHGIYVMLDAHQDGFSEYFCGEGVPNWAVRLLDSDAAANLPWYERFKKPFPAPYDQPLNESEDFYHEPLHQNAKFPKWEVCGKIKKGLGWGESTYAEAYAYQGLYSNWNGTGDSFASFWAKVASRFIGRPELVGLNLLNEPFAGDVWTNPLLLVPYPNPFNADRWNLQPLYEKINAAVRAAGNEDVFLFVAGLTWGNFGSGFSEAPGGAQYRNRTVVTYHFYDPPNNFGAKQQVAAHVAEARRLGVAAMMTETESLW